ncbi:hypothetical protein FNJ07_09645 [Salmonella enterica subsp. salamae]|nr:hypothetical protein [Salmonella enterica subsp. salamae]ECJ2335008.1 hypothetical protein [Salmonella enterica subsp. salamae]
MYSDEYGIIADLMVNGKEDENGMLMAAAPDLLEALQCLVKSYDEFRARTGRGTKPQALELLKARAAISKALGEE